MQTEKQLANLKRGQFSSTHQPKNRPKKRGKYLTSLLKKFLEKKIKYIDPETEEKISGKVKDAIIWRLVLNATQGENQAIQEIFDRIEGKLNQKSDHLNNININVTNLLPRPAEEKVGSSAVRDLQAY